MGEVFKGPVIMPFHSAIIYYKKVIKTLRGNDETGNRPFTRE